MTNIQQASKTALMVTAYRAQASAGSNPICHDPWAHALAGSDGYAIAERYDALFPNMALWMGVRTQFLDNCVTHYIGQGFKQVVILGAGLDTRSVRLAQADVRFFEVDHPISQAEKKRRIESLDNYDVNAATYVQCDFESQDFLRQLMAAGFSCDIPTVIVWEGVVCYLPRDVVESVCARVASECHAHSVLLFDYVGKAMAEARNITSKDQAMLDVLSDLNEPLQFGTNDLMPLITAAGFKHLRTISFDEACLSLTGTYDRKRRFRFQSMALVSRTPGPMPWA